MIGLIVTGHGRFASGISESVKMIAGEPENYAYADFRENMSSEDLDAVLKSEMEAMKDLDGILVLADLAGGTPFKQAFLSGMDYGAEVVGGCNLGMLLEVDWMRQNETDTSKLADFAEEMGREAVVRFRLKKQTE